MNTTANLTPLPAVAPRSTAAGTPCRSAPGIGLTFAVVASLGLWAGLAQAAVALVG